jgi:hypothetical protein
VSNQGADGLSDSPGDALMVRKSASPFGAGPDTVADGVLADTPWRGTLGGSVVVATGRNSATPMFAAGGTGVIGVFAPVDEGANVPTATRAAAEASRPIGNTTRRALRCEWLSWRPADASPTEGCGDAGIGGEIAGSVLNSDRPSSSGPSSPDSSASECGGACRRVRERCATKTGTPSLSSTVGSPLIGGGNWVDIGTADSRANKPEGNDGVGAARNIITASR